MAIPDVEQLAQRAGQLANAGRWQEAEELWIEVQKRDPRHAQALFSLGAHALQRGDLERADGLLRAARNFAPRDVLVLMTLASICKHRGDKATEQECVDSALAVDPYYVPALLGRGHLQEISGNTRAAAFTYANIIKISPPESQWPQALRPQLEHARAFVQHHTEQFAAYLDARLSALQAAVPGNLAARWRESAAIMAGASQPYHSQGNQLQVPRLPAITFYDRAHFPWLEDLEASTAAIREELLGALAKDRERFTPYIRYNPGDPVNQWRELNHSTRWSTLALWTAGQPVRDNLERCPATARALETVDMASISGLCPNAMFSALAPRTSIPPHHGETNARLVVHLPLVVPDHCIYRVGFDRREWKVGEAFVFDDTIEHEARNDSDELRVVLIFDVWNPLLTAPERELVNAMAAAAREFPGLKPS